VAKTPKRANKSQKARKGGADDRIVPPESVTFHYVKGPEFRTIHVYGAIGGLTTSGFLHIAFYCERMAIPQTTVQEIKDDGTLGAEIERTGKSGVVRQMETDIIINESTARNIKVWLDQKLEDFALRRSVAKSDDKESK
jgi:hypothetical protein